MSLDFPTREKGKARGAKGKREGDGPTIWGLDLTRDPDCARTHARHETISRLDPPPQPPIHTREEEQDSFIKVVRRCARFLSIFNEHLRKLGQISEHVWQISKQHPSITVNVWETVGKHSENVQVITKWNQWSWNIPVHSKAESNFAEATNWHQQCQPSVQQTTKKKRTCNAEENIKEKIQENKGWGTKTCSENA